MCLLSCTPGRDGGDAADAGRVWQSSWHGKKARSAVLVLGFVSCQHQRLAGTGWRHRQVDNPELTISKNSFSISHIMPNKSFPVCRVFTDPRQQHPELCRPFSPCSWSEQQQLRTTASSWEPGQGSDAAAVFQHPWRTPSPPMACPASREVPPQGSSWMAAVGQGMGSRRAGATTLMGRGLRPGAQDLLENTNQPCSVTPIQ